MCREIALSFRAKGTFARLLPLDELWPSDRTAEAGLSGWCGKQRPRQRRFSAGQATTQQLAALCDPGLFLTLSGSGCTRSCGTRRARPARQQPAQLGPHRSVAQSSCDWRPRPRRGWTGAVLPRRPCRALGPSSPAAQCAEASPRGTLGGVPPLPSSLPPRPSSPSLSVVALLCGPGRPFREPCARGRPTAPLCRDSRPAEKPANASPRSFAVRGVSACPAEPPGLGAVPARPVPRTHRAPLWSQRALVSPVFPIKLSAP